MARDRPADETKDQLAAYNDEQKEAFRKAYDSAMEQFGDEARALAIAHAAARGTPGGR